jgi:hypothetical protein
MQVIVSTRPTFADDDSSRQRVTSIADTRKELERECLVAAGGSWQKWYEQLGSFRTDLEARIASLKPFSPNAKGSFEARSAVLETMSDPPLFEAEPGGYLSYIYSSADVNAWVSARPFVAAMKAMTVWLRNRDIDLIVVPVPKLTEVYPDLMVKSTPPDLIVAPNIRLLLYRMLQEDVETVDLLPLDLKSRRTSPDVLYNPVDPHWSQAGEILAVKELGARLRRYPIVREILSHPASYRTQQRMQRWEGVLLEALTPAQKTRVEPALTVRTEVVTPIPPATVTSQTSPVVIIGDSYVGGVAPLLAKELNMPITDLSASGQTTEAIKDMVRDPSLLEGRRVIVLIVSSRKVLDAWDLPPAIRSPATPKPRD